MSALLLLIRGLSMLHHAWKPEFDRSLLRSALAFGLPLVPHAVGHWGLAVSDRAVLGAFVPAPVVGIYYVAYLLALPVTLTAVALSQATQPLHAEAATSDQRRRELGEVVTLQAVGVVMAAAVVALLGPPIAELLLPAEYADVGRYLPWLAGGACLFGLYLIPMNAVAIMVGRTRHIWMITVAAGAANIVLNLLVVPRAGAIAAAVNTCVGYGLLAVGVLLYAWRACKPGIPVDRSKLIVGIGAIAVAATAGLLASGPGSLTTIMIRSALLAAVALGLFAWGPLRDEARDAISAIRPAGNGARQ